MIHSLLSTAKKSYLIVQLIICTIAALYDFEEGLVDTLTQLEKIAGGTFFDATNLYNTGHCTITRYSVRNESGKPLQVAVKKANVYPWDEQLAFNTLLCNTQKENFVFCYGGYQEKNDFGEDPAKNKSTDETRASLPVCFLVMEYIPLSLNNILMDMHQKSLLFSPEATNLIIEGGTAALLYMHQAGILHGDIKSANILMQDFTPKFCDFGYTHYRQEKPVCCGSTFYLAPEVHAKGCSEKTDIFSFGVVMLEILLARTMRLYFHSERFAKDYFPTINNEGAGMQYCNRMQAQLSGMPEVDEGIKTMVNICLSYDPAVRPRASYLSEKMKFFKKLPAPEIPEKTKSSDFCLIC